MPLSTPLLESPRLRPAVVLVALAACAPADAPPSVERSPAEEAVTPSLPSLEVLDPGVRVLLQAVSPVSGSVVWMSGHQGTWIRTEDAGATWTTGGVAGHEALEFRDVHAFHRDTAVLLSAGPGELSRMFRTEDGGATWRETFVMDHPQGFLDCMDFWEDGAGLAYGDAVDGGLYLLRTRDGGRNWSRVDPATLPPALPGEGGFAASGTCLHTGPGGRAWVATGNGARPRLLVTKDGGATWAVVELPLAGGEARGAVTVGFRPDGLGFALGGDLSGGEPGPGGDARPRRVALSADGGLSWSGVGDLTMEGPAYGAAWVPERSPATLLAVGPGGMDWSTDGGMRWASLDTLSWWAVGFSSPVLGWAAGPGGRVGRIRLPPRGP